MKVNDSLLRELFRDEAEATGTPLSDEAFVRGIMQRVRTVQPGRLIREAGPWLVAVALVAMVSWRLLPWLRQLPATMGEWHTMLVSQLANTSIDSAVLLPLLALLLALCTPTLVDRLPRYR